MKFFNTEFKEGMPISVRGFARGIMGMARAVGEMRGIGCHLEWSGMGIPTIVVDQPKGSDDLSQPLPDSNRAELKQKSIQDREIDADTGEAIRQLYAFDDDDVTAKGLEELITADTETGKISAESDAEKYQLVTRIKTGGGYMIGYMPIGEGDGSDPEDQNAEKCDQNTHPASGGGGGGGEGEDHPADEDNEHPGEDDNGTGGDTGDAQHPASDDCYTTAA